MQHVFIRHASNVTPIFASPFRPKATFTPLLVRVVVGMVKPKLTM